MSNYSLEIISKKSEFNGKTFKKHHVNGIDTIGVFGNEPFQIKFKNNSFETVQVKISIDGTDLLTGDVANTKVSKDMWVVNPYAELVLEAWPESHQGGAQFVFSHAGNAVAANTHGDVTSLGIIAVAVFREGHKEPVRFVKNHYHYPNYWWTQYDWNLPVYGSGINYNSLGGTYGTSSVSCSTNSIATLSSNGIEETSAPGVGAGDYVEQKINYVAGLKEPYFTETLRVRFLWWDDLVSQLKQGNIASPHASGFPGDSAKGINLGNTPRLNTNTATIRKEPDYVRF